MTAIGNCIFYTPRVGMDEELNGSAPQLSMESVCGGLHNQVQVGSCEVARLWIWKSLRRRMKCGGL